MKFKIIFILFFSVLHVYSQGELNSGVTVQLNASSNSETSPSLYWGGWACGVNGTIVKGIAIVPGFFSNWRNLTGHGVPTNINLTNICAPDTSNALVCGTSGAITYLWKTTNGGSNWFQVFSQSNGYINAVWMKNSQRGIMEGNPVGGRWSLWKTTNGGINWDSTGLYLPQSGNETGFPNSLCMALSQFTNNQDSGRIWFGTNNSRIYYSSNYGQSWVSRTITEQNSQYIMFFRTYSNIPILYAGSINNLIRSTDFGSSWATDVIPGSGSIAGISCSCGFFVTARGNKLYTSSGTGNWGLVYTAPSGNYTYIDNRVGDVGYDHYATRDNGGITFYIIVQGIKKISSEIPISFSISQNYPNPFNPKTTIKLALPKSSFAKLAIYDILGRKVTTLVNEKLSPGAYEVEWDAGNYPSGVYFYKLETTAVAGSSTENFIQTKKLVLIK